MRFFTSGRHRYFERMMQELPYQGHDPDSPPVNNDCRDCLEFDGRLGQCRHKTCTVRLAPYFGDTPEDKNCPDCKHFDKRKQICSEEKCKAFSEP